MSKSAFGVEHIAKFYSEMGTATASEAKANKPGKLHPFKGHSYKKAQKTGQLATYADQEGFKMTAPKKKLPSNKFTTQVQRGKGQLL